jgi:uncharacterized protein (TIGR00375 family)
MQVYCDFHIHGKYSGGTSKNMDFDNIERFAILKGLSVVGTGDILHQKWLNEFLNYSQKSDNFLFIPTVEVEDINRVHHVLIFEDLDQVKNAISEFKHYGNLELDGRPKLKCDGQTIAKFCSENDILFGPAHAFTPYFGIYSHFKSLSECYGEYWQDIGFIELGLSADSEMADNISYNHNFPYLSNSDCHSYWPHRLGRECQLLEINKLDPKNVIESIRKNKILCNIGLNPREGKYHMTACNRCYKKYSLDQAKRLNFKCSCGGNIKIGVKDRILSLKDTNLKPKRPPYYYCIPLAELIELVYGFTIDSQL